MGPEDTGYLSAQTAGYAGVYGMRLRSIALIAASVTLSVYSASFAIDFSVYYPIANHVLTGDGTPYGEASGLPWPMWYRYPPLFLFLVFPFVLGPFRVGAFLFTLPKCWVLYSFVKQAIQRLESQPNWWIVALLAGPYIVMEFRYANAQFYVFALTAAALFLSSERPARAGVLLGTAVAIKIWPLFFVPYLAALRRWRAAGFAVATAIGLTLLPALYFGWSEHLALLAEWYEQESTIAATAGTIWFPSQSLFGVLTRYLTEIAYSSMPDSGYWNVNIAAISAETVRMVWMAIAVLGYGGLLLTASKRRIEELRLHAIAFCVVVLLQPFSQKQSALVVLVLPALVAGIVVANSWKTWPARLVVCAATLSVLQPIFASGQWQRTFQLLGVDALIVSLVLVGLILHKTSAQDSAPATSR